MTKEDPDQRASAAQMLIELFEGRGLTTPRHRIAPIPDRVSVTKDPLPPLPPVPRLTAPAFRTPGVQLRNPMEDNIFYQANELDRRMRQARYPRR